MKLINIATNLLIGFLGAGKTTAIQSLLERRPGDERWAVLVNEFGQVGVDSALLDQDGVALAEVAGGCMCCVTSQSMQVGLNRLLREARPQRLLIEPSGLGHPAQILETLNGPYYQGVLDVRATIGLLDARKLSEPRYREHPTFRDQIHLADVLVANKSDLYEARDFEVFEAFARQLDPPKQRLASVSFGRVQPEWLDLPRSTQREAEFPEAHHFLRSQSALASPLAIPDGDQAGGIEAGGVQTGGVQTGADHSAHPASAEVEAAGTWQCIEGVSDDYYSAGWRLPAEAMFEFGCLQHLLAGVDYERVKAVLNTSEGWMMLNRVDGLGEWEPYSVADRADRSGRLEMIDPRKRVWADFEEALKACLVRN